MIPVCLCFRAHQPRRLRAYNYFDIGRRHDYFDTEGDRRRLFLDAERRYAPAVELLGRLLGRHPRFAFSLALSGPLRAQLAEHAPGLLTAFRRLVETGRAEPLAATAYRCLRSIDSPREIEAQLSVERERVVRDLGRDPVVFGGEDPPDPQGLARVLASAGYTGMVLQQAAGIAGSARRRAFRADGGLPVLIPDDRLAARVAARCSDRLPSDETLTAERLDAWIAETEGEVVWVPLDLSAFDLTPSREDGVPEFFEEWIDRTLRRPDAEFLTPSQVFARMPVRATLPATAAAAAAANEMQRDALGQLEALERRVRASGSPGFLEDFRRLTASDHFEAMAVRPGSGTAAEPTASESPYEVYMAFRHAVTDLERRLPRPRPERSLLAGSSPA